MNTSEKINYANRRRKGLFKDNPRITWKSKSRHIA